MKTFHEICKLAEQPRFRRKWDPASHFGEEQELIKAPVHLVAPQPEIIKRSYQELIQDMSLELTTPFSDLEMNRISYYISKFVDSFLMEARKLSSSEEVERFADSCKARRNSLQLVTEFLSENGFEFYPQNLELVVSLNNSGYSVDLTKLHYTPNNIRGLVMWLDKQNLLCESVTINEHPKFYIFLYRIMFELIILFDKHQDGTGERNKQILNQMLLVPCGIGSIFEKLNPDVDLATSKMKAVIDELKKEATPLTVEFKDILYQVLSDIKKGNKRYVKELHNSLKRYWRIEKYSSKDVYATLKASPQGVFRLKKDKQSNEIFLQSMYKYPSIVNSIIEVDPLINYNEPWDLKVEFSSSYRILEDLLSDEYFQSENYVYIDSGVMTIYVPNPGKFKGRVIHLACNAIQDRLNPIHKIMERISKNYICDCTYDHNKGVTFLKQVTNPILRLNEETKHNVFVSDFSNATDTLSQEFQEIVIKELLDEDLAALWGDISRLEKVAVYPDGTWEIYVQKNGQPQGIILSFDFFSLAHHVLLLMMMYITQNTNILASTFYRILGDDSIVNYPIHDDGNVPDGYQTHSWLCKQVNLIKNDSKTGKSFYKQNDTDTDPDKVVLDFAKISVFEGEFCSSLPAGLGLHYCENPSMTKLGVLIWYAQQGIVFEKWAHTVLTQLYINDHPMLLFAEAIFFGGQQKFLLPYTRQEVKDIIGPEFIGLCNYCYSLTRISRSYLGFFISDTKKQKLYEGKYNFENISKFLELDDEIKDHLLSKLPQDHKYLTLYDDNENMANLIDLLYHGTGEEETISILNKLLSSKIDPDDFIQLLQFNSYINLIMQDHSYNLEDFSFYDNSYYFGNDGFNEKTLHTIKGGRESADALIFKESGAYFKKLMKGNDMYSSEREDTFRNLVSYIVDTLKLED